MAEREEHHPEPASDTTRPQDGPGGPGAPDPSGTSLDPGRQSASEGPGGPEGHGGAARGGSSEPGSGERRRDGTPPTDGSTAAARPEDTASAEPRSSGDRPDVPEDDPSGRRAAQSPPEEPYGEPSEDSDSPTATTGDAETESAGSRSAGGRADPAKPRSGPNALGIDEEAAWQAIVAGYGAEPPDPPGARPFRPVEDLALPEFDGDTSDRDRASGAPADGAGTGPRSTKGAKPSAPGDDPDAPDEKPPGPARLGGSVVFAPGVGPRDYRLAEPSDDDLDADDEGHFVPPEPPPLPATDTTTKFAWLAVLGGPLLLLLAVLLGWQMTWWLTVLGIGGFVGGFVTLVVRMNPGDEDDDDPGRGAVV